ncbi:hypothetical protein DOZ80_10175 [Pseudomonas fluorescens]|uniref:Uncharacterized protein n=1 Tax=Pseudomonas fluorescens TaxID=294 RepID=A0A327N957_PSEFL|nr:hypothetical protein DOZ80_10175 [Pseudomonas fluorescens]
MLAMVVNDYAGHLKTRGALESIASKLAPTGYKKIPRNLMITGDFLCPQKTLALMHQIPRRISLQHRPVIP